MQVLPLIIVVLATCSIYAHISFEKRNIDLEMREQYWLEEKQKREMFQNHVIRRTAKGSDPSLPSLPDHFDTIGPFPIGTRELGGDILSSFGGIQEAWQRYQTNPNDTYPSELADGGRVRWKRFNVTNGGFKVQYDKSDGIRWDFLLGTFGLNILQFTTWACGTFNIGPNDADSFLITCGGCTSFYLDDKLLVGDKYGVGYITTPISLPSRGAHKIMIAVQGMQERGISLAFQPISNELMTVQGILAPAYWQLGDKILPAGDYFSWPIVNTSPKLQAIQDLKITAVDGQQKPVKTALKFEPVIHYGQVLPLVIQLSDISSPNLTFTLTATGVTHPLVQNIVLSQIKPNAIFLYTFLDYDNSVQYAGAIPPKNSCLSLRDGKCPVIFTTHGAGSIPEWLLPYYRVQDYAWIIAPNGRRRFGYDWTGPQLFSGLNALVTISKLVSLASKVQQPNIERILFTGHSMGGRGCALLATHLPDYALAVTCAAGWIKYEQYIAYYTRNGLSFADSQLRGLLDSSEMEFSTDLYMENLRGVQFMTRCGGSDDDVHPWHPRRIVRIYNQIHGVSQAANVSEIPGKPHWWDGVVDDDEMQQYFDQYVQIQSPIKPNLPKQFTVVTNNPARFSGKGGIRPLQFTIPYRIAKIHVTIIDANSWNIRSSNVKRFGFYKYYGMQYDITKIKTVVIDGQIITLESTVFVLPNAHFCKDSHIWKICNDPSGNWQQNERSPTTYGPARQVYEDAFVIVYGTTGSAKRNQSQKDFAHYLANFFFYQGRASVPIVSDAEYINSYYDRMGYNVILLGEPTTNTITKSYASSYPVQFGNNSFTFGQYSFKNQSLGIQFLTRLPGKRGTTNEGRDFFFRGLDTSNSPRLGLVMGGTDDNGFELSKMLFPLNSGMLVPDYVVVDETFKWKGDGGMIAAGYWDNEWSFNDAIGYIDTTVAQYV